MEKNESNNSNNNTAKSNLRRRIFWVVLFVLTSPLWISALLHIPFIQNWTVDQVTDSLSERLDHDINIDYIDFSIFDGLQLEGFGVYTNDQDTILSSKSLNVSLRKNILSILGNSLSIESVELVNPVFNIRTLRGERKTNVQQLLSKLTKPKKKSTATTKNEGLQLDLKKLDIINLIFSLQDDNIGQIIEVESNALFVIVEDLDLDNNEFLLEDLSLKDPKVTITNFTVDKVEIVNPKSDQNKKEDTKLPFIGIRYFNVQNGQFIQNSPSKDKHLAHGHFDINNFELKAIEVNLEEVFLTPEREFTFNLENLSLEDNKDFKIHHFSTGCVEIRNSGLLAPEFKLITDRSNIESNLELKYRSYNDLKDIMTKSIIKTSFQNTKISLHDIAHFIHGLESTKFYRENSDKNILFSGIFSGRIANLKGRDVSLSIPGTITAMGNFGTRNLQSPTPLINLRLQSLSTSYAGLKKLIPAFNPPKNFSKLGTIDFSGNFDGYPNDFVAYGTLKTDLGLIKSDMRLDLKNGIDKASYSGDLQLVNFNLNKWTDNKNVGNISFDGNISNGIGLTLQNAYADVSGHLVELTFKDYTYKNININGALDKNKFDGKISSTDLNFNFGFDGFADFSNNQITFDFNADVGIIDLKAINLSKEDFTFRGNIDLQGSGTSFDDLIGKLDSRNLNITRVDTTYLVDSLIFNTYKDNSGRHANIHLDGSTIVVDGNYKISKILPDLKSMIKINYPQFTKSWSFTPKEISHQQDFKFDIKLRSNHSFFKFIGIPSSVKADTLFLKGYVNSKSSELELISNIPTLGINDISFTNVFIDLAAKDSTARFDLVLDKTKFSDNTINLMAFNLSLDQDRLRFDINTSKAVDSLQNFEIVGELVEHDKGLSLSFIRNNIRIFDKRWKINADNNIVFGKKYIKIKNFNITDGTRNLELNDIDNKGIRLHVNKFDIGLLNPVIRDKRFNLSGDVFSHIRVKNIFEKSPDLYGNVLMPNLLVNNDSYGELNLDLSKPLNQPLDAILSINNDENGQSIKYNASIDLDEKKMDSELKAKNVPLKILQYLLYKGIDNVQGYADISGTVKGPLNDLKIESEGLTHNGEVRVLVLGETFYFDQQKFSITDKSIDLDGAQLTDSEGGVGNITGGLIHDLFRKLSLDASIEGENVIALNTNKLENSAYYGKGQGYVLAQFSGNVNYPNINVNARATQGTVINIPIQSTRSVSSRSFITFVDKDEYLNNKQEKKANTVKIDGVQLEINLSMTEDAKVFLIFDESKGDIIEGQGVGNMQINMDRKGDFDIFGEYEIREGNYLFTALNFINKPFDVREGGKVRWNGDPVNATIDLQADYLVRTDLSLFLSEYLVTEELQEAASNTTDVNLELYIGNTLYNPSISFGLDFPDLSGELKSYADSKVRIMKNNQNDINNQVFGLMVFNSFLPSNAVSQSIISGSVLQSASINTLSEFFSNQLSSYVTRFINETLEENGLIEGVDFDINLRNNLNLVGIESSEISIVPTEIEVKLKNKFRFWDGRLSFDVGGNFVRESLTRSSNYVVPEFTFRYALTPDRKLNLKVYGKYDLDEIDINSRRQRIGLGLRYRTEFGSMLETKSVIKNSIIKI